MPYDPLARQPRALYDALAHPPCDLLALSLTSPGPRCDPCLAGFISHTFSAARLSLSTICTLLVVQAALCCLAIGLTFLGTHASVRAAALLAHAVFLAATEIALVSQTELDSGRGDAAAV